MIKTDTQKKTPTSSASTTTTSQGSNVNKFEMLRQIQSERNPDANKKITFNGKTCDFPSLQNPVLHRRQGQIFYISRFYRFYISIRPERISIELLDAELDFI